MLVVACGETSHRVTGRRPSLAVGQHSVHLSPGLLDASNAMAQGPTTPVSVTGGSRIQKNHLAFH